MTAHKYRNAGWTQEEMDLILDNLNLSPIELAKVFEDRRTAAERAYPELTPAELDKVCPGRTLAAVSQAKFRLVGRKPPKRVAYDVKDPGEYIEHLSRYLVEDFECMEIWARWHGYATWVTLGIDERGFVHVRCTAKGLGPRCTLRCSGTRSSRTPSCTKNGTGPRRA